MIRREGIGLPSCKPVLQVGLPVHSFPLFAMHLPDRPNASIDWLPQTLLLLGTDAAGKNHVARVWTQRMAKVGVEVRQQEGWLSASAAEPEADEDKSWLSHLTERIFLWVFPCIAWGMPWALRFLMRRDVRRFCADGQRRLVISHSALRILAFTLGARGRRVESLPESIRRAVRDLRERSRGVVIVLDVDPEVRHQRIGARVHRGTSDPFDRYMLADSERSERIEACLVSLATELMGAHLVVNNDLDEGALWTHLETACRARSTGRESGVSLGK